METFGQIIAWAFAVALVCAFPITEFARGMASNPEAHDPSRGGCMLSVVGLGLCLWFAFG